MRSFVQLFVPGGTAHRVDTLYMDGLQRLVAEHSADQAPLFLRLFGIQPASLQPVTSRALLGEVEHFAAGLNDVPIPSIRFVDQHGTLVGGQHQLDPEKCLIHTEAISLTSTADGIRLLLFQLPPPAGFHSLPGLVTGQYGCYFERLDRTTAGFSGLRTAAMPGGTTPVPLPAIPIPPVTQWNFATATGSPLVASIQFFTSPAAVVYKDLIHALISACNESIRLKALLQINTE